MMPAKRVGTSPETDVIGAFKRYGFVLIAVPAVLVALAVGYFVHHVIVRDFGDVFASGVNGTISEAYDPNTFAPDTSGQEHRQMTMMMAERIRSRRLSALRVQAADGTVVYSTNTDEIGTVIPLEGDALRAAQDGVVSASVSTHPELTPQGGAADLLVIGPVRLRGGADIVGAYTALKPYDTVRPSIRASVLTVTFLVLTGAMIAYVFLRLMVARAEREVVLSRTRVANMNERLGRSVSELERVNLGTLQALNAAVDAKDRYTALHSLHVADYACALGMRLGMEDQVKLLERAGLLHDIGKIGISETILQKTGPLSPDEFRAVQDHSRIGATMIETVPFLRDLVPAVMSHHEHWDGSGYPEGLVGEQIPLMARVLGVVDAFDAMTTERPYRAPISLAEARIELMRVRGTQLDPHVVDSFIDMLDDEVVVVREVR